MNLIQKDFLLIKNKLLLYGAICLFIVVLARFATPYEMINSAISAAVGPIFAYFVTMIAFEAEGKHKSEILTVTLPYMRHEIIRAKYKSVLLTAALFYLICIIVEAGFAWINGQKFTGGGIVCGIALSLLVYAFMIPFFVKLEYVKAANLMMMGFMMLGVLGALVSKVLQGSKPPAVLFEKMGSFSMLAAGIAALVFSYLISEFLYERKEFS
ncbi:ABC-2 transporter permease [Konateibacter massiliensis]|uniref:ABC-2 transporter permease n=1 Tax=Konateibacter massiliensis TaxID=2002841 RepID=UPI0015D49487|nr:ABC-2 transporter permease [Konateibacter massiliensis]